jgi:hypothetical protein
MAPPTYSFCPNCGTRVLPGADFCQQCYQPLPRNRTSGSVASSPSSDPLAAWPLPRGPIGLVVTQGGLIDGLWMGLGLVLIVFGIASLVAASFVRLEETALFPSCSAPLACVPAVDLSVAFGVAGAIALIGGIGAVAYAFKRGMNRSSFLTLPP